MEERTTSKSFSLLEFYSQHSRNNKNYFPYAPFFLCYFMCEGVNFIALRNIIFYEMCEEVLS